jgi:uncharacterized membrane protein YkvA (DUF1232 family)
MQPRVQDAVRRVPPWAWLVAGAIYVVCPLDFDFIPVIGWFDDAFVAYWCVKQYFASNANSAAPSESIEKAGDEMDR